jgi:hypothetical protein
VWDDYGELRGSGSRWKAVLAEWKIGAVVTDERDWTLGPLLERDGWTLVARSGDAHLYVRPGLATP